MKLDNPVVVQWEYASEERLATRNETYRSLVEGVNAEELAYEAVAECAPKRLLEVGCGIGELAERVERRDALGTIAFPDADSIRTFTGASITRAHLASDVPEITEPFPTSSAHAVFVAEKAA